MVALDTEKMPRPGLFVFLAIIARNVHDTSELCRNRLQSDTSGHGTPCRHHPLPRFGSLFTDGATTVMRCQLAETVPMDRVSAWHLMRRRPRTKQIFLTHGAVASVLSCFAIMVAVECLVDTHATVVTVLKVLGSADTAKTAVVAVVGIFLV